MQLDLIELLLTVEQADVLAPLVYQQAKKRAGLLFVSVAPFEAGSRTLKLQAVWVSWDRGQKVLKLICDGKAKTPVDHPKALAD